MPGKEVTCGTSALLIYTEPSRTIPLIEQINSIAIKYLDLCKHRDDYTPEMVAADFGIEILLILEAKERGWREKEAEWLKKWLNEDQSWNNFQDHIDELNKAAGNNMRGDELCR